MKHPISEETIGFRLQAAIPNQAGRDWRGNPKPSFTKRYLVAESSDMSAMPEEKDYVKFCEELKFLGFKEFPIVAVPKV